MERQTLSVRDAATALGVHPGTVREAIRKGEIRAVRIGRRLIIPKRVIDDLLRGSPVPDTAAAGQ